MATVNLCCPDCQAALEQTGPESSLRCPRCDKVVDPYVTNFTPAAPAGTTSGLEADSEEERAFAAAGTTDPFATALPAAAEEKGAPVVRLPGLKLLGVLGRGGMGVVYKARHLGLQRLVAVKMILTGRHAGPEEHARFRTEAEAIARLQHPNIVQIYDVGEQAGLPYFTLEYCPGGNLATLIEQAALPASAAARLVEKLARAMAAAHAQRLIHRDLKPGNVLLTAEGEPKITDFGLAKRLDTAGQTRTGAILGTPNYMAPEQTHGERAAQGPWTDVYALGAILYELVTGRPPFKGADATETILQVQHQEPLPPTRLQPGLARDLETICLKCLQKEPHKRYASADALAEDLRRFAAGEAILARPVGKMERALKWARRRPLAAALVAVSALALVSLCGGALLYARYQEQQRTFAETQLRQEIEAREHLRLQLAASQEALATGKAHFERHDWPNARTELVRTVALTGETAQLAPVRAEASQLLERTTARLAEQAKRRDFKELRDQALFHWSQVTGLEREANLRTVRTTAAQALQLFDQGLTLDGTGYTEAEKAEIRAACYVLLFVLADASAQALPGEDAAAQADLGLRRLDEAARLRRPGLAVALRRADFLRRKGEAADVAEKLQPEDALDHFLCGLQRYQARDPLGAVAHFEQTLRREPDHFWAHFLTGVAYLDAQQPSQARFSLTACLGQRPDFFWAYVLRGHAHGELGAQASVPAETARAFQAAEEDFRRAEELGPDAQAKYVLHVNRGVLRLRQKQPAQAADDFRTVIGLRPALYQTYLNLAEAHVQQAQWDQARAQLDQALALQPRLAAAHRARARLALLPGQRDLEAALRDLEAACADDGDAADHKERGVVLLQLGRPVPALEAFTTALKLRPDYAVAQRLRAETLMELERHAEAVAAWDSYLQAAQLALAKFLQAKEPVANAYRARGVARARLGQPRAALADYNRALELEESATTYAFRGWIYVVLESPSLALGDFEQALALEPKNADAYNGRGWCRVQLHQLTRGLADVEQAVRLGPRAPRLHYNAARTYAQALGQDSRSHPLGDAAPAYFRRRALALLREALALVPTPEQRATFWREVVQGDRALLPLRDGPEFAQLAGTSP